jgi:hypothetical protein
MGKNIFVMVLVLCFFGSIASGLDPMGPPAASLEKGEWSVGVEYSYSDMEIERQTASWSSADRNVDIEMHKTYGNIGYGISENVTGFVRLGLASMEWDRISGRSDPCKGDDGDWDFAWGGGIKATLCQSPDVSWGFLIQFSESDLSGDMKANGSTADYEVKLDEIQFAIGPTWQAGEGIQIYGGPFVELVRGKLEDKFDSGTARKPIEEEAWLGGYVGTAIELAENSHLTAEYMLTADGWAVAGGVCWMW